MTYEYYTPILPLLTLRFESGNRYPVSLKSWRQLEWRTSKNTIKNTKYGSDFIISLCFLTSSLCLFVRASIIGFCFTFTPHNRKILLASPTTTSIHIQIWFCSIGLSWTWLFHSGPITTLEIVPILNCHLFKNFHLKHVELQFGIHVIPNKCKRQLISGVKCFQLIEHKTWEEVVAYSMLP